MNATWQAFLAIRSATTSRFFGFTQAPYQATANANKVKSAFVYATPVSGGGIGDIAAVFAKFVNFFPSTSNKGLQYLYRKLTGVTADGAGVAFENTTYPAQLINFSASRTDGVAGNILYVGKTGDGNDLSFWQFADWLAINGQIVLDNAVIEGSNNPSAPLYYSQNGIDQLQKVLQSQVNTGTAFGLISGSPQVNAVPYAQYKVTNPSDVAAGIYRGLSLTFTPQRGFASLTVYLTVTNISAAP